MPLDDTQLMREVQAGRLRAFDALVARHREPLVRAATSKLGDRAWAEDVVQETFLAVHASRHTFDPAFSFRTWLWTILLNLCRRQWARRARRPRELVRSNLDPFSVGTPPEPVHHETGLSRLLLAERAERVAALLADLPEPQADALRLRFYGGLKYEEIAASMGSSLSAAKVRVRKGLRNLARRLRAEEGESR